MTGRVRVLALSPGPTAQTARADFLKLPGLATQTAMRACAHHLQRLFRVCFGNRPHITGLSLPTTRPGMYPGMALQLGQQHVLAGIFCFQLQTHRQSQRAHGLDRAKQWNLTTP